jgi:hypothetical protein
MTTLPSKEALERLREKYPVGTRIELLSMSDPYSTLKPGDCGFVSMIDDTGTIFADWDSGSTLGLVYGVDGCRRVAEPIYENAAEFWRNLKEGSISLDAALEVGGKYIGAKMRHECTANEIQFCREFFAAMYTETRGKTDPARLVYPYDKNKAEGRAESSYFQTGAKRNSDCASAIDEAIRLSRYRPNQYNHALAAMKVAHDFGFARVNLILAHNVQKKQCENPFSDSAKKWAGGLGTYGEGFAGAMLDTHPTLVEKFIRQTRLLYGEVGAERFALPGRAESGRSIHGYEIVRAVEFDSRRGFAIGLNPYADLQFVSWQFTVENGSRDYYRAHYCDDFSDAAANYIARVIAHTSDSRVKEIDRSPVTAEIHEAAETPEPRESEQNFAAWMAVTERSRYRWTEDEIYRLNGRGAMYYTGGEDGVYIRIRKDGVLEAGNYEGAIPHIGEAVFMPVVDKRFDSFSEAYKAAMEAGGKRFMVDMFSGADPQPLIKITGAPEEKPSVLKQIRDTQKAPKSPRADKSPKQRKRDIEH